MSHNIVKTIKSLSKLENHQIQITLNNNSTKLILNFDQNSIPHLLGLQYLYSKKEQQKILKKSNKKNNNKNLKLSGSVLRKRVLKKNYSDDYIVRKIIKTQKWYSKRKKDDVKNRLFNLEKELLKLDQCYIVENKPIKTGNMNRKISYFLINPNTNAHIGIGILDENDKIISSKKLKREKLNDKSYNIALVSFFIQKDNRYYINTKFKKRIEKAEIYDNQLYRFKSFNLNYILSKEKKERRKNYLRRHMAYIKNPEELNADQIDAIARGITHLLTQEQIDLVCNKEFNVNQIRSIIACFDTAKPLDTDYVKLFAKPEIEVSQMNVLSECIKEGFSKDQIARMSEKSYDELSTKLLQLANRSYNSSKINHLMLEQIYKGLDYGVNPKKLFKSTLNSKNKENLSSIKKEVNKLITETLYKPTNRFMLTHESNYLEPENRNRMEVMISNLKETIKKNSTEYLDDLIYEASKKSDSYKPSLYSSVESLEKDSYLTNTIKESALYIDTLSFEEILKFSQNKAYSDFLEENKMNFGKDIAFNKAFDELDLELSKEELESIKIDANSTVKDMYTSVNEGLNKIEKKRNKNKEINKRQSKSR